jgi:DNA-binding MarR family transcriptional regulator
VPHIGWREQRMLDILRRDKRMTGSRLLRAMRVSADELHRTARGLEAAGMVRIARDSSLAGRSRVIFELAA